MSERVPADLQAVGDMQAPLSFTVTPELNQQCLYAQEDFAPRYLHAAQAGPVVVHPALLLNMSNVTRSPSFALSPGLVCIHAAEETDFLLPAHVGESLTVTWQLMKKFERMGRQYQLHEALIRNEGEQVVLRRRTLHTYELHKAVEKGA